MENIHKTNPNLHPNPADPRVRQSSDPLRPTEPLRQTAESLGEAARETRDGVQDATRAARERLSEHATEVRESIRESATHAREAVHDLMDTAEEYVRQRPGPAIGAAFLAGMLIAALLRP